VLVVRVHEELLKAQKIPPQRIGKQIWDERYEDIRSFESYLDRNGIGVVKFFLNVSKAEQKRRFIARLDEPEKNWKFAATDVDERQRWRDYMKAYEDAIRETATPESPWYVVPADNKWFTRLVDAGAMVDALANLGLRYPVVDDAKREALGAARRRLEAE
jgi:polyphosphate kinase 2 (PPK2 family)